MKKILYNLFVFVRICYPFSVLLFLIISMVFNRVYTNTFLFTNLFLLSVISVINIFRLYDLRDELYNYYAKVCLYNLKINKLKGVLKKYNIKEEELDD